MIHSTVCDQRKVALRSSVLDQGQMVSMTTYSLPVFPNAVEGTRAKLPPTSSHALYALFECGDEHLRAAVQSIAPFTLALTRVQGLQQYPPKPELKDLRHLQGMAAKVCQSLDHG